MRLTKPLAACLLISAVQVNAEPFRLEVSGTISESDGDWSGITGEAVTIQFVGDLDTANGSLEMIDNGEEPPFPRYTFSGGSYGMVFSGAFGELTTTTMSFEPVDNFDTDADGNPFGLTGVVDALVAWVETPNTAPFFGGEVQIMMFQDSAWFDGATSLPTEIDLSKMLAVKGQAQLKDGDTLAAEAVLDYPNISYVFGSASSCSPSGTVSVGDTVNGDLSRVDDCYFENSGRLRDFSLLTLETQSAFSLSATSSDFSPLTSITASEAPFSLLGSALDEDNGSNAAREFLLPADTYRIVSTSKAMDPALPPAGQYSYSLSAVSEPQLGCQNTTIIAAGIAVDASLDTEDCQDDSEGRATEGLFVDGYTAVIPAGTTLYATLEADFVSTLVWEKSDDSDDVIESEIAAGEAFTMAISADAALAHTLVIAAADNASLGAYSLSLSDTAPGNGGSGGSGQEPGTTPEPGAVPDEDIPSAVKINTIGGSAREASFALGAYGSTGEATYATEFTTGDFVTIVGEVRPDPEDVGTDGELYAAMLSVVEGESMFTFLNTDGDFEPWDRTVPGLGAAEVVTPLQELHEITVFEGTLQAGVHKITFAYYSESGILVYMKPITIRITD